MADRKIVVEIKVKVSMRVDEGQEISQVVDEMDYSFYDDTGHATIEDTEILGYELMDSK